MTFVVPIGMQLSMAQNIVYALPARRGLLFCDAASPTFEQSSDLGFTLAKAVTLTNGQAELAGGFLRSTGATATTVFFKTE